MNVVRRLLRKNLLLILIVLLIATSIPFHNSIRSAGIQDCPFPGTYDNDSQALIKQYGIPTSINNGRYILNGNFLSNKCGLGTRAVVYGSPASVVGNQFDQGQWRYLGYDINGQVYRNWLFRSDSRATLHVAKYWVKNSWDEPVGKSKGIKQTPLLTSHPDAKKWLESIVDPYKESPTFLQSYNKRKGTSWDGNTLKDYVIIQQMPTKFGPGVVQMWNIWQPDGSWWYEMFIIPPTEELILKKEPDLVISDLVVQTDAWVGDSVPVKITTKNEGDESSGPFTVGIEGTNIKSEVISNVPPGQIKTVTVNVTSTTAGIKKYTAKTDFGLAVTESNENNNTKPFQIVFSKKNEPTIPVAIISHLAGDHRTDPEITIAPGEDPELGDELSYSPGGEKIISRVWRFTPPGGTLINRKPTLLDFDKDGKYKVELRVTNDKNKTSEWAELIVKRQLAPPEPTPPPEPSKPKPVEVAIHFDPQSIFSGDSASLLNDTRYWVDYSWSFADNLSPLIRDPADFQHGPMTFSEPGIYKATLNATGEGGDTGTDTAILYVNDPKPVALISGVNRWIQGRPFPQLHHLNNSYTPLASRGVSIDFSRSEMRFKKIENSDFNNYWPDKAPMELGFYNLEGKVYDSQGRASEWASHTLEIVPDQPPTIEITAPVEGVRNNVVMLYIQAFSPDGDEITNVKLEQRYDVDGDGNIEEEPWAVLYEGANKTTHSVTYTTVGMRQYRASATENYGLSSESNLDETNIINLAPTVNFNAFGTIQQPDQGGASGPPMTNYTAESILRSWTLKKPYVGGSEGKAGWKVDGSALTTRNSVWADFNGNYNLANNLQNSSSWEMPYVYSYGYNQKQYMSLVSKKVFKGYRMLFKEQGTYYPVGHPSREQYGKDYIFHTVDAKTGTIKETFRYPQDAGNFIFTDDTGDHYYFLKNYPGENSTVNVYNSAGVFINQYPGVLPEFDGTNEPGITQYLFSKDGKYLYLLVTKARNQGDYYSARRSLHLVKYSLAQKTKLWTTAIRVNDDVPETFQTTPQMSLGPDGSIYVPYSFSPYIYEENIYQQNFAHIGENGNILNHQYFGRGRLSSVSKSTDGRYAYMSGLKIESGRYGLDHHLGVYIYDSQTKSMRFTSFYSHTTWNEYEVDRDASIAAPAVSPTGAVYVSSFTHRAGGFITKEGNLISDNRQFTFGKTQLLNQRYGADGGDMSQFNTWGFIGAVDSVHPFYQPNGEIAWTWGAQKWYSDRNNRPTSYTPWIGLVDGDETPVSFGDKSTYWESGMTTIGGWIKTEGIMPQGSSKAAPDGSIYLLGTDMKENIVNGWNNWIQTPIVTVFTGESTGDLPRLIDDNTVEADSETWGGLFYDPHSIMKNQVLEFNVAVNSLTNNKVIGAGIRIQNEKNFYAVEWTNDTMSLYKVANGAKTELAKTMLPRSVGIPYSFKIEAINDELRVFVNNAKKLEARDATYANGSAGMMSLGQQQAAFSRIKRTNYGNSYPMQTYDSVLVNDPISYEKLFDDVEKDLIAAEEWSYSHNPNYFNNPEGFSVHNGKSYGSTINALEKPGVYDITFRAEDDPGLHSYRKWSEPVTKLLYVHRRPVAQPDVRFSGGVYAEGELLNYETFDTSYDPDLGSQLSDRLFRTRWADESTWTTGKRQFYSRLGVELIVQEQVRDMHGAWSFWGQSIVYKAALPPVNQNRPVMTITYPSGTTAATATVLGKEPTVTWTYTDADNDPQEQYELTFTYADTNEVALSIQHEGSVKSYKVLEGTFQLGRIVKVQGRAYSAGVWSELSNIRFFVLNLPPETFLVWPAGPNADHPVYMNVNRPQLRVFTVDPENQPITAIDYEVIRSTDGVRVADSNAASAAPNYITPALAEGLHYWRARANDGFVWGPYSNNGFFFVDTVKSDDVDEKLEIEPTAVTVRFNAFRDKDPSSGHAARTFYLQKVNADRSVTNVDLNGDGTTEYSIPLSLTRQSYKVTGLIPGQEYRLTVLDYDTAGNEGHYAYIYFYTNRPPTGDFNWSPNPVYEGDSVTFRSVVKDPDSDTLAVSYALTSPSGVTKNYSYTIEGPVYPTHGPSLKMTELGTWSMRMTVSDGIADPIVVTKTVQVRPLQVDGYVKHTDLWDQHRRSFNRKQTGHDDSPRGYSVFWAGEKFMLEADTTLTGTITEAERVEVEMGSYATELVKSNPIGTSWKGSMWNAAFSDLPEGALVFTFTAYYSNGTVKTVNVEVAIDGQTLEIVGVHRVQ
ncbi:Athe_2463 domain-containing protein [Paenibacillus harenae]|uniref:Athe_2463 domain-containing protein n=1 Tax=Paenibacillus harenae TaxID=306543 RepID=UPI003CCBB3C8